ncbi:MAG TPA: FHA domain-containing protein [Gemmataceae bacterium]|nr:FHA domain-containing protein [Gemmataceae bacterium]
MHLRLKVVQGKPQGHCLDFAKGEFMFGRGPECDVRPESDLVSRQHCMVHVQDASVLIRDLGSRNGTLVNGKLVLREQALHHGDTLQLGPLVLQVLLEVDSGLRDTAVANKGDTAVEQMPLAVCSTVNEKSSE